MTYTLKFRSKILFLMASLVFGTCSAQVYEGKIGKSRITVCFGDTADSSDDGVYYYDRHKSLIYLSRDESKTKWFETEARGTDKVQAIWNLNQPVDFDDPSKRLSGEWGNPDGSIVYPIDLQLVGQRKDKNKDSQEACSSDAFHEKLERNLIRGLKPKFGEVVAFDGATTSQGGNKHKLQYQKVALSLDPKGEETDVSTVILNPGDKRYEQINSELISYVEYPGLRERQLSCRRETLRIGAPEGTWRLEMEPSFWTSEWLQVTIWHETNCGGPHPNEWKEIKIWNLDRQRLENLADWFVARDVEAQYYPNFLSLPATLLQSFKDKAALIYEREGLEECKEALPEAQNVFLLSLTPSGMGLMFDGFSYSRRICSYELGSNELLLPYKSLYPYLSETGKRNITAIIKSLDGIQ